MKLLLDTNALLWWLNNSPRLSKKAKAAITDLNNSVLVSAVSVWEISIKQSLGKLRIPNTYINEITKSNFLRLPISFDHASAVTHLPHHHKDPFDRMLVAQAQVEGLALVSSDSTIRRYGVSVYW